MRASPKSSRSSAAAIAARGAGRPVQISHWAHPCSKSISTPSTTVHPAASASATNGVCRGMYAASRQVGRSRVSSAAGSVKPALDGVVSTTYARLPSASSAAKSSIAS